MLKPPPFTMRFGASVNPLHKVSAMLPALYETLRASQILEILRFGSVDDSVSSYQGSFA